MKKAFITLTGYVVPIFFLALFNGSASKPESKYVKLDLIQLQIDEANIEKNGHKNYDACQDIEIEFLKRNFE